MRHTQRGMDRMVNFSDAVVAVAITILALPLVDIVTDVGGGEVGEVLAENWFSIWAFLLSFVVIARFWMGHHQLFERVKDYNSPLLWANVLWLASIVFFPVATEAVTSGRDLDNIAVIIYIGTMLLTMLAATLQVVILRRNPELVRDDHPDDLSLAPNFLVGGVFALALVVAIFSPYWGMWTLTLLAVTGLIEGIVARTRARSGNAVPDERSDRPGDGAQTTQGG